LSLCALRPASARESEHADHRALPHPFEIYPCLPAVIPLAVWADGRTVLHFAACDIHECRSTKIRDGCPDGFEPIVSSAVSPHLVAWRYERSFPGTPSSELSHEHTRAGACPWARLSDLESGNAHASLILASFAAGSLPNMVLLCRSDACYGWTATLLMSATDRYAEPGRPTSLRSVLRTRLFLLKIYYDTLRRRLIRLVGLLCYCCWCWPPQEDHHPVRSQRKEPRKRHCYLGQGRPGEQGVLCPSGSQDRRSPH
jgi:hypothetical protein